MSKSAGLLFHPLNNHPTAIYEGFSWPCLFFGFLWYIYKGVYIWALISFFAAVFTYGLSTVVFPFLGNKHHKESLLKKGYLSAPRDSE